MHIDFQEYIQKEQPKKIIVLHHWDTDGLVCAGLFLDYFDKAAPEMEVVLMNPTINNYFLVEKEYEWIKEQNAEVLLTTDINFPVDVIERLEDIVPQVYVFDHHSQTAHIDRPGVQNTKYPGCTMLVNDYLMLPMSLTGVLGAVGDQEERIVENTEFYPMIEQVMQDAGLSFEETLRITKLIDTSYIIGKEEDLHYAIELIRDNPAKALTDERLLANDERIKTEFDREVAKEMEAITENIVYMPIESELSLISEVTRAKAREHEDLVVVTQQTWGEMSSFYVRRRTVDIDLGVIVDMARGKGFNAGGKPEVAGVVIPTAELDQFREEVFATLKELVG